MLGYLPLVELKGKHIFVTGAGKRLGRALCDGFLPYQVKISAHYRKSVQEVTELKNAAQKLGSEVLPLQADLTNVAQLQTAVKNANLKFGPIDILINCASEFFPTPLKTVTESQWDLLLDANVRGQFFLAQAAASTMNSGLIINFGDVHALRPTKNHVPYFVSKAGMLMLTKALAKELSPQIRVNTLSPGHVLAPPTYTEEQNRFLAKDTLFGRLGTPDDIVAGAFFLIENDYVTGFNLVIDGGTDLV